MRTVLVLRALAAGATGAAGGARVGGAESGFDGSNNLGAMAGDVTCAAGARGATSESEVDGFGGADTFDERGARSLDSAGGENWRENGSRREGAIRGSGFAACRGCELGATRGAMGCTGAA